MGEKVAIDGRLSVNLPFATPAFYFVTSAEMAGKKLV
jgi:hypothetical protein